MSHILRLACFSALAAPPSRPSAILLYPLHMPHIHPAVAIPLQRHLNANAHERFPGHMSWGVRQSSYFLLHFHNRSPELVHGCHAPVFDARGRQKCVTGHRPTASGG